ncbi:hypothetical protein Nmel_014201 [Mimus melanotis]
MVDLESSPEGRRVAAGLGWAPGFSRWAGRVGISIPPRRERGAAQDRGVSSPACLLQGSALMHFYLLEEARPRRQRHGAAARWSTRTAPAGLLGQPRHCGSSVATSATERARELCWPGHGGSPSTAVCAEEQAVKGRRPGLGLPSPQGGRVTAI